MFQLYLAISFGTLNIIFMSYVTYFWYCAWRDHNSPAAHALTVSSIFITVIVFVGLVGTAIDTIGKDAHMKNTSLLMAGLTFVYVGVQVMLTRGYFNKEKNNGC